MTLHESQRLNQVHLYLYNSRKPIFSLTTKLILILFSNEESKENKFY